MTVQPSLHPRAYAKSDPDKPALIVADRGEILTYGALEAQANRAARLFRQIGLRAGDRIGMFLRNGPAFPIVYWAAQRAGLLIAPLSTHLKEAEAAYILRDCNARALVGSGDQSTFVALAADASLDIPCFDIDADPCPGARNWTAELAPLSDDPIADETAGYYLVYSSGTTGRPKGIMLSFTPGPIDALSATESISCERLAELRPVVTFNGAPLYHAAPLVSMISTMRLGGTAVVMRKFNAEGALKAIQDHHVVHAQFVPTMFVRMLALPAAVRDSYDISSLGKVVHAAAPCPVDVKRQMIDWFGPIIDEYYSGTEAVGQCYITSQEWLRKPGSVGRAVWGIIHICGEDGSEMPVGQDGAVYFETDRPFAYLNDDAKTAAARHPVHPSWIELGDIGHVDQDGYLFLTDRKNFMIISGGVNIYPQAVENLLIEHPEVADAAVIGVPHAEFGEEVLAVVQPAADAEPGQPLERRLIQYCRTHMSHVASPRRITFVEELPRLPTGKLAKHELRDRYAKA